MGLIKTTTIRLKQKIQIGTDAFNRPIYDTEWIEVNNVLFGEPSSDEIVTSTNLYGKKIDAILAIPKGDTNSWENTLVEFNGHTYKTLGTVIEGIEENIPLSWHKKVRLTRYVDGEN